MTTKTNELPGTRAQVRHVRMSASKAREVLDLVRGLPVAEAAEVLQFTERGASAVVAKCLASAVANAQHNDELDADLLYVSTCYADEGPTLKRWRPRARGRATRIRKRMCHITIIVSPMPAEMTAKVEAKRAAGGGTTPSRRGRRGQESRRARVARSRGEAVTPETEAEPTDEVVEPTDEVEVGEPTDEMVAEAEEAAAEDEPTEVEPTDEVEVGEPTDEMVEEAEEAAAEDEDEPTDDVEDEVVAEDEDDESADDDDVDPDAEEKK
jgi:large subunit ribosomal protein L22